MALRSASVFNPAFLDSLGMSDDRALMKRYIENKEITIRKDIFWSRFREQILFKCTKIVLLRKLDFSLLTFFEIFVFRAICYIIEKTI